MIKNHGMRVSEQTVHRLPSTKSLQVFVEVTQKLNFTHAAEELNMTQGAISRQIIGLESLLNVTLFERHARKLKLTRQGEEFLIKVEKLLFDLNSAVAELQLNQSKVKLCVPSCITSWLLERINNFQLKFPELEVELTSTMKHGTQPKFQDFDLVVMYGKAFESDLYHTDLLFEEVLTPVVSPLIWSQSVEPRSERVVLEALTLLHPNKEHSDWKLWLSQQSLSDLSAKSNLQFSSLDQAMNAAVSGFGVAIGDLELAKRDLNLGRLLKPFDASVRTEKGYYLLSPKTLNNEAATQLLSFLLDER